MRSNSKSAAAPGKPQSEKPKKPRPDYPLTPRADGRWQKKIRGVPRYFTGTADEALAEWLRVKDHLLAGHEAPAAEGQVTLHRLCNEFMASRERALESGDLSPVTYAGYQRSCRLLLDNFGKLKPADSMGPSDFAAYRAHLAATRGAIALTNELNRVRTLFKFAVAERLIERPPHYEEGFRRPSAKRQRIERAAKGEKLLAPAEIRSLIAAASPQLAAMLYLGLNCGFGPADCGRLTVDHLDLDRGWLTMERGKTGITRRIPLWPETSRALREVIDNRRRPRDPGDDRLVFLTRLGLPWFRPDEPGTSAVAQRMAKLFAKCGIDRPGIGLYTLRHCLQTHGEEAAGRDFVAVSAILGHADQSMSARYRERVSDDRLRAITDHVRAWLVPEKISKKISHAKKSEAA